MGQGFPLHRFQHAHFLILIYRQSFYLRLVGVRMGRMCTVIQDHSIHISLQYKVIFPNYFYIIGKTIRT